MAASNKSVLTALLVAIAMVAPNLQPSSAAANSGNGGAAILGDGAAMAHLQRVAGLGAVARMTTAADQQQPPTTPGGGGVSQPTACRPLLQGMLPCAGFLSGPRVYAPPGPACCAGLNAMFQPDTITCMCHVVNGDVNGFLPAPVQRGRLARLLPACGHNVPVDRFAAACRATVVPPIEAPPVPVPTPPTQPVVPTPPAPDAVPSPPMPGTPGIQ